MSAALKVRRFGSEDLTSAAPRLKDGPRFPVHSPLDKKTLLRKRLKKTGPDLAAAVESLMAGQSFADPGARDDVLWRLVCAIAIRCPELDVDDVLGLFDMSIKVMAAAHPGDHLTLDDVREKFERARRSSRVSRVFLRGDEAEIAEALISDLGAESSLPPLSDLGAIYMYDEHLGTWREVGEHELSQRIQSYASTCRIVGSEDNPPRPLRVSAAMVNGATTLAKHRVAFPGYFGSARTGVAFENGFVVIKNGAVALEPHSPDNRMLNALPFPYVQSLTHAAWDEFLHGVFRDDPDQQLKIQCVQEFVGASLFGIAHRYAVALILLGEGRNGKSVLLKVISALFPRSAISFVAPHLWEKDDYRRAELAGKLLNVVSELPRADVLKGEAFKAVVAGDEMHGRRIYESPFNFQPRAGHVFAANCLPPVDDLSRAFWERVLVITFNRVFTDRERVKGLDQHLIHTELAGIAAWAVEGARRLLARGATATYTVPPSHSTALQAWRLNADQVAQWVAERTRPPAPGGVWLSGSGAYADYGDWAHQNGHHKLAANKFGERLRQLNIASKKPKSQVLYELELVSRSLFHRP